MSVLFKNISIERKERKISYEIYGIQLLHIFDIPGISNEKPTISVTIFWDFSMFYQIFLSQQVNRWAIITYKHGIYELPREVSSGLELRILGPWYQVSLPKWKFC